MMTPGELTLIYMDRFINRVDLWGKQWVDRERSRASYALQEPQMNTHGGRFIYEPLSPAVVRLHFDGRITCAFSATDKNNCGRWICFDSDTEDGDLDQLEKALRSWGVHCIREARRPGRAGHLWVLFDKPIAASQLIIFGNALIRLAEVRPTSDKYPHGIELFPKTANGYSQVRAPLGINLKPEANFARGCFDGVELTFRAQLEWLAKQPLNRADEAIAEAKKHQPKTMPSLKAHSAPALTRGTGRFINIRDYVNAKPSGKGFVAACPCCVEEGHDRHGDNLSITADGKFCCMFGGSGKVHKNAEIVKVLLCRKEKS